MGSIDLNNECSSLEVIYDVLRESVVMPGIQLRNGRIELEGHEDVFPTSLSFFQYLRAASVFSLCNKVSVIDVWSVTVIESFFNIREKCR